MKFIIKSIDGSEFELSLDKTSTVLDLKSQIVGYYQETFERDSTVEDINDLRVLFKTKALLNNDLKLEQLFNKEENELRLIVPNRHKDLRFIGKEISAFFSDSVVSDLNLVGIKKTLGYLTVYEILEGGYKIAELEKAFQERGITTYINQSKGFFYAYHRPSLQALLTTNSSCLEKSSWPTNANEFVQKVGNDTASEPELWALIHRAFTDASCVQDNASTVNLLVHSQIKSGILAAPASNQGTEVISIEMGMESTTTSLA